MWQTVTGPKNLKTERHSIWIRAAIVRNLGCVVPPLVPDLRRCQDEQVRCW